MPDSLDVVVAGGYCLDLIFTGLPAFPQLGLEVVAQDFEMAAGGAFISAAAMRRLGLRVAWAADFGLDRPSRLVLDQARAEGLDETWFVRHPDPLRNVTVAISYPHERAFLAYYDPKPAGPAALAAVSRAPARAIYLAHFLTAGSVLEAALGRAEAEGILLFMDGNMSGHDPRPDPSETQRVLACLDVFLPNASEARRLAGRQDLRQAIRALADLCPVVIVKDGAEGAYACARGEIIHEPALPIAPLDTTGAGDCFSAGFVKAWLDGRPLAECLRWGNIVGGLSTLALGGAGRVVTPAEVQRWL